MPKVNNSVEVTQQKLSKLISEVNLFLGALRGELIAIQGKPSEYAPPIDSLKDAHQTAALQPKVHGLMCVHLMIMMIMMIMNGAKIEVNKKKLDKMVWGINGGYLI